jgi:hypothetical protein
MSLASRATCRSLLQLGTVEEVTAHCRDLIQVVSSCGGFILDVGAVVDEAKDGNMLAMIRSAKEYAGT